VLLSETKQLQQPLLPPTFCEPKINKRAWLRLMQPPLTDLADQQAAVLAANNGAAD